MYLWLCVLCIKIIYAFLGGNFHLHGFCNSVRIYGMWINDDDDGVSSFYACLDPKHNWLACRPINRKQNQPRSQQMPEMITVVVHTFLTPP
jgi:hypothetical protein